jgi:hypothetical protein
MYLVQGILVWLYKMTVSLRHVLIKTDFKKLPCCYSLGHITFPTQTPLFIIIINIIIISRSSSILILSGVRLSPLGTVATTGLLSQPQIIDDGDYRAFHVEVWPEE